MPGDERILYASTHLAGAQCPPEPDRSQGYVMNPDGSEMRQITNFGRASFAPFFHPDGRRIIFSSNMQSDNPRNFDLYLINVDGSGLERITYHESFDGFPMFNRAGTRLVFASNRSHTQPGETNIFLADWIEDAARR